MKIAIVCDSFKESLTALEVADEVEAGFTDIFADAVCIKLPAADGGEGTAAALTQASGGQFRHLTVTGPLGAPVAARYGLMGDGRTAVVEMASAAGLDLVPRATRNPMMATSFGVGELIGAALDDGCRHIILALGGSATNDGGAGMAQALGARLLDAGGCDLRPGGAALVELAHIDMSTLDPRLAECEIEVACDVDNPLTGPAGASAVFGPQKGATPDMVAALDAALARYGAVLEAAFGQAVADRPGAGAAGGMGAGAMVFLNARLRPGVEIVTDALGLDTILADVDLVITGEGRMDGQTVRGKTPVGVARVAKRHGKPVIALAGSLGDGHGDVHYHGIDAVFSIVSGPCSLDEALAQARANIRRTARNIAAVMRLSRRVGDA
ncbi:glycerate kinase [Acetobacter sp. TBRC 12305]|uniref:Glycerate kinase n=1 Tax=Acetobacter garciniae TaxID=2817435 RepID=A0A939KNJ3_9PROT|nr:glycerate kinase [Acetobacter garciniae]MBO1326453.1 glycerate kinase [Acetobacter garciniae]MBX0346092.1 glycerate kinase [Acetobacter garciniae]